MLGYVLRTCNSDEDPQINLNFWPTPIYGVSTLLSNPIRRSMFPFCVSAI